MRRALLGFVIGSSLPATVWPLAGLGIASRELTPGTLNWLLIGLFFPVLFGLTNMITMLLPGRKTLIYMFGLGAVMGLISASTGTFLYNIPEIVYGLEGNQRYLALLIGPIFYGFVWAVPVRWLNRTISTDEA